MISKATNTICHPGGASELRLRVEMDRCSCGWRIVKVLRTSVVPEICLGLMNGSCQSGEKFVATCWSRHDEDTPLLQLTHQGALSWINDGGRKGELVNPGGCLLRSVRDDYFGASLLESNLQIEREHGLLLHYEDEVPVQIGAPDVHGIMLRCAYDKDLNVRPARTKRIADGHEAVRDLSFQPDHVVVGTCARAISAASDRSSSTPFRIGDTAFQRNGPHRGQRPLARMLVTPRARWAFSEPVQAEIAFELALAAPELIQLPPQDFQRHAIASRATIGFEPFVPGELVEFGDPLIHKIKNSQDGLLCPSKRARDLDCANNVAAWR